MKNAFDALRRFWDGDRRAPAAFLGILVAIQILAHAPMLGISPRGMHVWRQVVGHAAVQNYVTEDDRFWYPRADIRLHPGDTGAIYHELPLTYWLAAKAHTALGWGADFAAHFVQLLFNLLLIPGAYLLARALGGGRTRGALFAFLMALSPLYAYYAPLLEPNMLGLSFFLFGLGLFLPGVRDGRYGLGYWTGTLFLVLGTLAKPTFLFYGLPMAVFVLPRLVAARKPRGWIAVLAAGAVILAANVLVIRHAQTLYDASPFQRQVHTPIGPSERLATWAAVWDNVKTAATTWFIEMEVNLAALPFFLIGLVALCCRRGGRDPGRAFWWAWIASTVIFCAVFVARLGDHDYYITAALPLAAWASMRGVEAWWASGRARPALGAILLVAVPAVSFARAYGRWRTPQVPETLLTQGEAIASLIPPEDLVLVDGDKTPIVDLYYLRRKGLSLWSTAAPLTDEDLADFRWLVRQEGSKYLSPRANDLPLRLVANVGDFTVYRIERPGRDPAPAHP